MRVELVRAWARRFEAVTVEVETGARIGDALAAAGWALEGEFTGLAIFGVAASEATPLYEGDRIELLRPLEIDPKQARRLRAERVKST
ncbi:MAG: RnfH family protein [Thermomonas sp.]|uniref:RnfH family protein n=1 Tax=Thermomonas sp. TaxID=1971895 RepID=UPI0039E5747F